MNFTAQVKSVRANLVDGEIRITLDVPLNKDSLAEAGRLSLYADPDGGSVEVTIVPKQGALMDAAPKAGLR